ncbi:MAG: RDD family protein [Acidimicrobiales bacterium]|nr:RDD family protein [Acidimicrobiales bacterium]HRW39850.1 RDD family protein [Aquihabitans sp.]
MELDDTVVVAGAEGIDHRIVLAGIASRGSALALDLLLQFVVLGVLVALLGAGGGLELSVLYVLLFLVLFGYPVLATAFANGQTVGKRLLSIAVVRDDGSRVGFLAATIRTLLLFVDALPGTYTVGMVAIVATKRSQRIGDLVASTIVVRRPRRAPMAPVGYQADHVPAAAATWSAQWDLAMVTPEEVAMARSFLERRAQLTPDARWQLAVTLADQLRPKVAGVPLDGGPEAFLERIVVARTAR